MLEHESATQSFQNLEMDLPSLEVNLGVSLPPSLIAADLTKEFLHLPKDGGVLWRNSTETTNTLETKLLTISTGELP